MVGKTLETEMNKSNMNKSNMKESIMQSYYAGGFIDSSSFKEFVSDTLDMIDLNTVDQKQLERFISNWCDVPSNE